MSFAVAQNSDAMRSTGSDSRAGDGEMRQAHEEIVVTATLRETNLQETPVAITAMTEEKLLGNFINSIDDVALVTPNVTVAGRRSPLSAPFIIRGLGSNLIGFGLDDAVAQYVNGVYLGRPAASAFNFIDIERLEVLRGAGHPAWLCHEMNHVVF